MKWAEYPLVRPTIAFIFGILIFKIWNLDLTILLGLFVFNAVASLGLYFYRKASIRKALLSSISVLTMFFLLGWILATATRYEYQEKHFAHQISAKDTLVIKLTEDTKINRSVKTFGEVLKVNTHDTKGKMVVYFEKDSLSSDYRAGDIIVCSTRVQKVSSNTNPEAFDYKNYLNNRHVHHQVYIRKGQHHLLERNQLGFPFQQAYNLRKWGLEALQKALPDINEYAVASAMILGVRQSISEELYTAYSETGAVHVLAVSGLHVGIITMLFIYLLKRIRSKKNWVKILKLIILLSIVCTYSLVTGAAPAVMRASVMFSFFLVGKYWFDNYNIYNILTASALVLLVFDPLLIFQASFQFSYMALTSIIFFHKMIYSRWVTKWKASNFFINLAVVSIAAQILVFPVTIFYFHKLPTYFILSGVASVALAPFVLGLGLVTIFCSSIPVLFEGLSWILSSLLKVFIGSIFWIHKLPMSKVDGLWLSWYETLIIYIGLIALMFFVHKRKMLSTAYVMLSAVILLLASSLYKKSQNANVSQLTIYETSRKQSYLELYENHESKEYSTDGITAMDIDFIAANHRLKNGITTISKLNLKNGLFNIRDKVCYMPSENETLKIPRHSDCLLLVNQYDKPPKYTLKFHSTDFVIIDKSISFYIRKKWKNYCKENGIQVHDISENGAFVL